MSGAPPDDREERKDRKTREAIDRVEERLRKHYDREMERINDAHTQFRADSARHFEKLEEKYVTHRVLLVTVLGVLGLIGAGVMAAVNSAHNKAEAAIQRADKSDTACSERVQKLEPVANRAGIDARAALRICMDGVPRKQVIQEWEAETDVPRINAPK